MPADSNAKRAPSFDHLFLSSGDVERRQIIIHGVEVIIQLHRASWDALDEICRREGTSPAGILIALQEKCKSKQAGVLRRSVEVFIVAYFRQAANWGASTAPIARLQ